MACEANKPILVHDRDAHYAVIEMLDKYKDQLPTVIIHCFTGTAAEIREYVARGFYIGVTGFLCKGLLSFSILLTHQSLVIFRTASLTEFIPVLFPYHLGEL